MATEKKKANGKKKTGSNSTATSRQQRKERRQAKRKQRMGRYRSVFERNIADDLEAKGIPFEYEPWPIYYYKKQPGYKCLCCDSNEVAKETPYWPDFVLENGIIIEAKGRFTSQDRTKMLAVKRDNPDLEIRMIFLQDNWVTDKRKQRYSDWAKKNGFPYEMHLIPGEWANEYW